MHDARPTDPTRAVEHATIGVHHLDPYARLWDYMFLGTERPSRRAMGGLFLIDDLGLRRWADLTAVVRETYMTTDWSRHEDYNAFENIVAAAVETAARRRQEPHGA